MTEAEKVMEALRVWRLLQDERHQLQERTGTRRYFGMCMRHLRYVRGLPGSMYPGVRKVRDIMREDVRRHIGT